VPLRMCEARGNLVLCGEFDFFPLNVPVSMYNSCGCGVYPRLSPALPSCSFHVFRRVVVTYLLTLII